MKEVEGIILPKLPNYLFHSFSFSVRHTYHPLPDSHSTSPLDIQIIIMSLGKELKQTGKYNKYVKYDDTIIFLTSFITFDF